MNIIAVDIGNSTITVGLFIDDNEQFIESVVGSDRDRLSDMLIDAWGQFPYVKSDTVDKREGAIVVSSVKPEWCDMLKDICINELDEKIKVIGIDIDLPIEMAVDNKYEVGTDRIVAAAAAFAVIENAVTVADFGSAVTIDLVDEQGVFLGGVIAPGFGIAAEALGINTAQLPEIEVSRPKDPIGGNTYDAINSGLYYSAVGLLKTVCENYAEQLDMWPQTIVTGGCAEIIKQDCDFVDSWVPNLVVKGILLAYKKHLCVQVELGEMSNKDENNEAEG
jgi:type III pantothenate kinase